MLTIENWLKENQSTFRLELCLLACKFLNLTKAQFVTNSTQPISPELIEYLCFNLKELKSGTPFFYLIGNREFWSLDLEVNQDVLIPRPESELLVEKSAEIAKQNGRVLELGTGSGAVSIALAKERPDLNIVATDVSLKALKVAQRNVKRHHCKIELIAANWFQGLKSSWDLIISNPPYISKYDPHLFDLRKEPNIALIAGISGFEALNQIIDQAHHYLEQDGYILLEHGFNQAIEIRQKLTRSSFSNVASYKDLNEIDRVTIAEKIHLE